MKANFEKDPSSLPPVSLEGVCRYSKRKGWIGGKESRYIPPEVFRDLTYNSILSRYGAKVEYCIQVCQARLMKMGVPGVSKDYILKKMKDQWASFKVISSLLLYIFVHIVMLCSVMLYYVPYSHITLLVFADRPTREKGWYLQQEQEIGSCGCFPFRQEI